MRHTERGLAWRTLETEARNVWIHVCAKSPYSRHEPQGSESKGHVLYTWVVDLNAFPHEPRWLGNVLVLQPGMCMAATYVQAKIIFVPMNRINLSSAACAHRRRAADENQCMRAGRVLAV